MGKNVTLWGASYSGVPQIQVPQTGGGTATFTDTSVTTAVESDVTSGKIFIKADGSQATGTSQGGGGSGVIWQDGQGYVHLSDEGDIPLQTKTVTPTTSAQTITADNGYYALEQVNVSAVATGTAGTPTATKGAVSNHSISVTPSVTNTTGYITGSTKTGTVVTVSASELVSGTKSIIANGTGIDVTNYASVDVNVSAPRTATILTDGIRNTRASLYCEVYYGGTHYYTKDDTFTFSAGGTLEILIQTYNSGTREVFEDGESIAVSSSTATSWRYDYTLPDYDVDITLKKEWSATYGSVEIRKSGSGVKNYVEGTFVYDSGGTKTLNIPYNGNGYPILIDIHVSDGMYDTTSDWYNLVDQYKVGQYSFVKGIINTAPDYDSSTYDINSGLATVCYKNSTSDATIYALNSYNTTQVFTSSSPSDSYVNREVTMQNATQMKLAVGYTKYSFAMNIEYTYHIVYSE